MYKSYRLLITVGLFFAHFCASVNAQSDYDYTVYTQEDGLASGASNGIAMDSTGFLWVLSENGLSRFDGYSFQVFTHNNNDSSSISSSNIYSISIDDKKRIFFNTENSISLYNPTSDVFESVYAFKTREGIKSQFLNKKIGLINAKDLVFIDPDTRKITTYSYPSGFILQKRFPSRDLNGTVWLSNGKSILSFNSVTEKFSTAKVNLSGDNAVDSSYMPFFFFLNEKNETCYLSKLGMFKYHQTSNSFSRFSQTRVQQNAKNPTQRIFCVNKKYIAFRYLYNKLDFIDFTTGAYYSINLNSIGNAPNEPIAISQTTESADGTLWVSTANAGVYRLDLNKMCVVEHLYHDNKNKYSLPSNTIQYLLESQGIVWMISPGIGLIKAEKFKPLLSAYRPNVGNSSSQSNSTTNVRAIGELDKNNLLIGTLTSLWQFNKTTEQFSKAVSPVNGKPVLTNFPVSAIYKDGDENIWIANWGNIGVTVLNYKTKKQCTIALADSISKRFASIRSMFIDSHNFLWLGTNNNLILRLNIKAIDFEQDKTYAFEKFSGSNKEGDSLAFNITFAFAENTNQQVLIGTEKGLYVYDYPTGKFKHHTVGTTAQNSISDNNVRSLLHDKNNLWIGTNGGGLNLSNNALTQFKYFSKKNGLADDFIYTIQKDTKGNLWLGTNRGLCCFNVKDNYIRNYSMKDGIQNFEFNTNAAFKTSTGELVFGGVNGFNLFNPDSLFQSTSVPVVIISEFKVNDKSYPVSDNVILSYNQNSISFQFAALSYYRNQYNQYAYKLDGVNSDWVFCDMRRFSNYAGLDPGTYTFHVKACNYNGVWNNEGATIYFTITPPFWNTWWFKAIVLVMVSTLIYLLFRYRLHQKIEVERIRNKIARDLHDEVGSNLTSISLFSAVALEDATDARAANIISKISNYTQTSQEAMNDIVWMINADNDNFGKIIVRIRKYAAETFESTAIQLHLNLDEELNNLKIPMEKRKNFYLIFKEATNNVVKYAMCNNIWINLKMQNSLIELIIKDDGIGFDTTAESQGNGIANMNKRADVLGGKLIIDAALGKGTEITFSFKV